MEESPACSSSSEGLMAPTQRSTPSHSKQICHKCECDETSTFTSRRQSSVPFILLGIILLLPLTQSAPFGGSDFDIFRYKCPDRLVSFEKYMDLIKRIESDFVLRSPKLPISLFAKVIFWLIICAILPIHEFDLFRKFILV